MRMPPEVFAPACLHDHGQNLKLKTAPALAVALKSEPVFVDAPSQKIAGEFATRSVDFGVEALQPFDGG